MDTRELNRVAEKVMEWAEFLAEGAMFVLYRRDFRNDTMLGGKFLCELSKSDMSIVEHHVKNYIELVKPELL